MSYHPATADPGDVAWLARQIEDGRGQLTMRPLTQDGRSYSYPTIRVISTDTDLLDRFADVLGTTPGKNGHAQPQRWQVIVIGSNAAAWMRRIRPTLTGARADKVDRILAEYDARGQRGRDDITPHRIAEDAHA